MYLYISFNVVLKLGINSIFLSSTFKLYWLHFIVDLMHPPPVKIVNYVKLFGKHGQRKFQMIYLLQRHIKYPFVCIIYKFNNYFKKKYGRKIQNKTIFIRVYFQRYALHPKNQQKLWSEEIITKIALELIHVSIYLLMSF